MSMTDHDLTDWGIALVEQLNAVTSGELQAGDIPREYLFAAQTSFKRAWNEADLEEVIPPLKQELVLTDQQTDWLEEYFSEIEG